jgi:diacylglycerol O-acyltransferase
MIQEGDSAARPMTLVTSRRASRGERLSRPDTARWYMSTAENPMVIGALLLLDGRLGRQELDELIQRKLLCYPRFQQHVVEGRGAWGRPRWQEDAPFDLRDHVGALPGPISAAELADVVSERMDAPLAPEGSPWHFDLIDLGARGSAILVRVHHCIADGLALVSVLGDLADERPVERRSAHEPRMGDRGKLASRIFGELCALFRFLTLAPDVLTSMRRPPRGAKRVAWSRALPLDAIKSIARARGCRVTDLLLGAVSAALERYLRSRGENPEALRALLPVAASATATVHGLGNHFGSVFVRLPLTGGDALARTKMISREMASVSTSAAPLLARGLVALTGAAWPGLQRRAVRRWSQRASLVISSLAGPPQDLRIAGHRLRSVAVWAPAPAMVGLSLTLFGYAGELRLGVLADTASIDRPEELVHGFEDALAEIGAGAPPAAP